jgi:hypothetical protein
MRLWVRPGTRGGSVPWVFTGRRERTGPRALAGLCLPVGPISRSAASRASGSQQAKTTLAGTRAGVPRFLGVAAYLRRPVREC